MTLTYFWNYWWPVHTRYWFGDMPWVAGFVLSLIGGVLTSIVSDYAPREGKSRPIVVGFIFLATYVLSASAYYWDNQISLPAVFLWPFFGYFIGVVLYPHGPRLYKLAATPHGLAFILVVMFVLILPFLAMEWNNPADPYTRAIQDYWFYILLFGVGALWYLSKKG